MQDRKASADEALLQAGERCNELDTLLRADLLRRQQELAEALAAADVAGDRRAALHAWPCFGSVSSTSCRSALCTNSDMQAGPFTCGSETAYR